MIHVIRLNIVVCNKQLYNNALCEHWAGILRMMISVLIVISYNSKILLTVILLLLNFIVKVISYADYLMIVM